MSLSHQAMIWLLKSHRDWFARLKKIGNLSVSTDSDFLEIHSELLADSRANQTFHERYNLHKFVQATAKLSGAIAEAGVYRGGTAKLICKAKGQTPLYLFDTFGGMPTVDQTIDPGFVTGQFSETSLGEVKDYLKGYPNVYFYPGFFPDSARGQEPENATYRLVHLDMDLYQSTFDALGFFYPRMVQGGLIVSHDYNALTAPGVKKAFDEFFADKPEVVMPLWDSQCVIGKA